MKYSNQDKNHHSWMVVENQFHANHLKKYEAIMTLGNGYMGIRSSHEEHYLDEMRNTFISGTFNRFSEEEVTELPNMPDLTQIKLILDDEVFSLTTGRVIDYRRELHLWNGEVYRVIKWQSPLGKTYKIEFKRFVSHNNLHLLGQQVKVTPLSEEVAINIVSGIDGQVTNSAVQHFIEGNKRFYYGKIQEMQQKTTESDIEIYAHTVHRFVLNEEIMNLKPFMTMDRRKIAGEYACSIPQGQTLTIEKLSMYHTSRDCDLKGDLHDWALSEIEAVGQWGYDLWFEKSAKAMKTFWDEKDILIEGKEGATFDQLAIRFAQFHLKGMTPAHDNRMNIGAKGLSGEGYKGHTFWDTEIFILPYFIYSEPQVARQLLIYRYHSLNSARQKARDNGYKGAMYPWESAWIEDGEVTPVWGAADIVTGERTKIWSGFIEQHITADVAYAVWQYYQVTGDHPFMEDFGFEILAETANFWCSRLEWNSNLNRYEINDVVGPDEYKEHVNNNAFTNYMAHWNIELVIHLYENEPAFRELLSDKMTIEADYHFWQKRLDLIYRPQPNADQIIPQDDTYLQKKNIDLGPYKNKGKVGLLFKDYNLEQVNQMQVTKQADVMILMYLLEHLFTPELKQVNFDYYEPRTLHDSSLSLSTHCVLACDLKKYNLGYSLFEKAARIDLGDNMSSSDQGLHAASIGGMWQCIVNGFGGVRNINGMLRIEPSLPEQWQRLKFEILWQGNPIIIEIEKETLDFSQKVTLSNKGKNQVIVMTKDHPIPLESNGQVVL